MGETEIWNKRIEEGSSNKKYKREGEKKIAKEKMRQDIRAWSWDFIMSSMQFYADANPSTKSNLATGPNLSFVLCIILMDGFSIGKKLKYLGIWYG